MPGAETPPGAGPRRDWLWKMLLEVFLIGVAVFLGMAADQWRTDQQHREQARAALQRFQVEITNNRKAVQDVIEYHVRMRQGIIDYLNPTTRESSRLKMEGLMPARFESTAWDLAIATQALVDIDTELAFELTRVYGLQDTYVGLSSGIVQAMYLRPPSENLEGFLQSVKVYYDDVVIHEPALIALYDKILPAIDRALKH